MNKHSVPWLRRIAPLALLAPLFAAHAFDFSKVPDGVYYYGTNLPDQFWGPLMLVDKGRPLDPLAVAQSQGRKALEGPGRSELLRAMTAFGHGCVLDLSVSVVNPQLAPAPTVLAIPNTRGSCDELHGALKNWIAREHPELPNLDLQLDNPYPTLQQQAVGPGGRATWYFGVPGWLQGRMQALVPQGAAEWGGTPDAVHGLVSRAHFVSLPILGPSTVLVASHLKQPYVHVPGPPTSRQVHRERTLSTARVQKLKEVLRLQLLPTYAPRLIAAFKDRFGGIQPPYLELGLIQHIDLDGVGDEDLIGVARINAITEQGPWRWIDVVWMWRSTRDPEGKALQIVRTSEAELMGGEGRYLSEHNPAPWAPTLAVAAIADLDRDWRMEIITSLIRPVGTAQSRRHPDAETVGIWQRDAQIHAWEGDASDKTPKPAWRTVYQLQWHEPRIADLPETDTQFTPYGSKSK